MAEAEAEKQKQKIVICGAGNAAHIFCGLCSADPNNEVTLMSLFQTEAADFKKALMETDQKDPCITIDVKAENKKIKSKPSDITNDPKCLEGADIIIISLPAFAHGQYVQAIKANAKPKPNKKILVTFWPGGAGLECEWRSVIGKSKDFVLMSSRTLPWAARIVKFGQSAEILGTKAKIEVSVDIVGGDGKASSESKENDEEKVVPQDDTNAAAKPYILSMQNILGAAPVIINTGHILNMSLAVVGSIVHPSIMYAKWNGFDGKPLAKKPLFYQGITEEDAQLMSNLSDEITKITEAIEKETGLKLFKQHIFDWYKDAYGKDAGDASSLYKIIITNPGYNGLTHPMIQADESKEEYLPNYNYRYLSQDIPYGLLVIRGFSLILDEKNRVKVPLIDNILKWAQTVQKREYFKYNDDGTIIGGKDIGRTRAPQRYDIKSIKDLV